MNNKIIALAAENTIQNVKNRPGAGAGAAIRNFGSGSRGQLNLGSSAPASQHG
jgi:hypothetical protein